jgi:phosphoenolpyruvate-protein kinase (PTS system EI component)
MIPLVSNIEEVIQARKFLDGSLKSLQQEGLPHAENVQFGIMVEVPSAALLVEHISKHVDFFSIGTNDLTQYTLAVDRTNERVADLASPFHPAVLKLIAMTIQYAHGNGKWVGLCGEMAGDPTATAFLLGVGLDEFSMAPTSIPVVKQVIRGLEKKHCSQIAAQALELPSTIEVKDFLKSVLN